MGSEGESILPEELDIDVAQDVAGRRKQATAGHEP